MPKRRPGVMSHNHVATRACKHGDPVVNANRVGIAVKTAVYPTDTPIADRADIAIGETHHIIVKGEVETATVAGFARGDAVYIVPDAGGTGTVGALTETATNNVKFGRVTDVAGVRGLGAGRVRIDLDAKDSF